MLYLLAFLIGLIVGFWLGVIAKHRRPRPIPMTEVERRVLLRMAAGDYTRRRGRRTDEDEYEDTVSRMAKPR